MVPDEKSGDHQSRNNSPWGEQDVCTERHGNLSNSWRDISHKTTNLNLMVKDEKSGYLSFSENLMDYNITYTNCSCSF